MPKASQNSESISSLPSQQIHQIQTIIRKQIRINANHHHGNKLTPTTSHQRLTSASSLYQAATAMGKEQNKDLTKQNQCRDERMQLLHLLIDSQCCIDYRSILLGPKIYFEVTAEDNLFQNIKQYLIEKFSNVNEPLMTTGAT